MNKLFKNLFNNIFFLYFTIFIVTFYTYFQIFQTFFQQDEWYGFGQAIYAKYAGIGHLLGILGSYHLTPLANILFAQTYFMFGINPIGYAWISLGLHILTCFSIFFFSMQVFKNKHTSFLAAMLFAVSNTSQQAVTYFATSLSTIPATLFGISSCYLLLLSEKAKKHERFFFLFSLLLLVIGLGFKEDIVGLFLLYAILFIFIKNKRKLIGVILVGFLYTAIRILLQIFSGQTQSIVITKTNYLQNIFYHAIDFYPKAFSQTVFTQVGLLHISKWFTNTIFLAFHLQGNPEATAEIFTSPLFAYIIFFIFVICLILFFLKKGMRKEKKTVFMLIVFIFVSILPFILLPPYAVMESRHFYFPLVGGSMAMAYIFLLMVKPFKNTVIKMLFISLIGIYIFWNISLTREQLLFLRQIAAPRVSFVKQLQNTYRTLPQKIVFYASGDPLPLQSGPGEFLMVLFHDKQKYYLFFNDNYFWDHLDSYQEKKDTGFGFFYNKGLFLQVYKQYGLSPENVLSFEWDDKRALLVDTTENTRKELYENQ